MVVARFLERHGEDEAQVDHLEVPVPRGDAWVPEDAPEVFMRMQGVVRLDPRVSGCSGMFIARIRKLR
ncbi:hypothetical protein LPJ73_002959 [Coemansia sp. RSA 2703]|nr:hypothetical protein LPJ73_002959 [Coemansia sp. RSA 2703]